MEQLSLEQVDNYVSELVQTYRGLLKKYILRLMAEKRNEDEVEDILQDIFLRVLAVISVDPRIK